MRDIAEDIRRHIVHEIDVDGLNYTSQLKNSWEIEKQEDGSLIIGSRLLWAKIMDDGRLPGKMPPVKVLIPWVFQKLGAKNEQELKQKAFLVARKIAEKGTEPRHYVKRALLMMEAENSV